MTKHVTAFSMSNESFQEIRLAVLKAVEQDKEEWDDLKKRLQSVDMTDDLDLIAAITHIERYEKTIFELIKKGLLAERVTKHLIDVGYVDKKHDPTVEKWDWILDHLGDLQTIKYSYQQKLSAGQ